MDTKTRKEIEKNIFNAAHAAIGDWESYPWHEYEHQITAGWPNSSQALSIDVFGTLKAFNNQEARDAALNAVAVAVGMDQDHHWSIDLEWEDEQNHLCEDRRTQVDVKAQADKSLLMVECKFTEPDGGSCSQPKPISKGEHKGQQQCNGAYTQQRNPVNEKEGRCALAGKGIRYWELIPDFFNYDNAKDYEQCPFKGGWYQWMRNLVLSGEIAKAHNLRPKVVVVYVDSPSIPFKQKLEDGKWAEFLCSLKNETVINTLSYQQVLELGVKALRPFHAELEIWEALKRHVETKIARVTRDKMK